MTDRSKIKARIAALMAMTKARGCTEAEAMAAAAKAADLMREYGIAEEEIGIESARAKSKTRGEGVRDHLAGTIASVTNTAVIYLDGEIEFFGAPPGPEIASYLWVICNRAVDRAITEFKTGRLYRARRSVRTKREAVADFTAGIVARLQRRLTELFAGLANSDACMRAKKALAIAYPKTDKCRAAVPAGRFGDANVQGWQAGASIPLSMGVGQDAAPGAIGAGPKLIGGT